MDPELGEIGVKFRPTHLSGRLRQLGFHLRLVSQDVTRAVCGRNLYRRIASKLAVGIEHDGLAARPFKLSLDLRIGVLGRRGHCA